MCETPVGACGATRWHVSGPRTASSHFGIDENMVPPWIEQFLVDVRVAVRSLLRNRTLTATVVLTLALGIGANAAVFSVVRGVLLRPLVNRDEDRLVYFARALPVLESRTPPSRCPRSTSSRLAPPPSVPSAISRPPSSP